MTSNLWMLVTVFMLLVAFAAGFSAHIRFKKVSNDMLALGIKEMNESIDSLLKTPEELPDEVFDAILAMNKTALLPGSDWRLYRLVVQDRKRGFSSADATNRLANEVKGMRQELKDLFFKANIAWLSILASRNPVTSALLSIEMSRLQVQAGKIGQPQRSEAIRVLPDMCSIS